MKTKKQQISLHPAIPESGGVQDGLEKALEEFIEADYPDVSWLGNCQQVAVYQRNYSTVIKSRLGKGWISQHLKVKSKYKWPAPCKVVPDNVLKTVPTPQPKCKKLSKSGVMYTEDGDPYIHLWPASRPSLNLKDYPKQSVEEASVAWIEKARGCTDEDMT